MTKPTAPERTDEPERPTVADFVGMFVGMFDDLGGAFLIMLPGVFLVAAWFKSGPAPTGPDSWTGWAIPLAALVTSLIIFTGVERRGRG